LPSLFLEKRLLTALKLQKLQELRRKGLAYRVISEETNLTLEQVRYYLNEKRREDNKARARKWDRQHPLEAIARNRKYRRERYAKNKELVLKLYGNKCACCGESRKEFLTLDHINEDGANWRKRFGKSGSYFYQWVVKNNFPEDLQILCWNCNLAKHIYKICPHKVEKEK